MKTPRELLLEQHKYAESNLDRIRREIVANAFPKMERSPLAGSSQYSIAGWFWHELIVPYKTVWLGLTAVWFVTVTLHLATEGSVPRMTLAHATPASNLAAQLSVNRAVIAELVSQPEIPPAKSLKNKPRTEVADRKTYC